MSETSTKRAERDGIRLARWLNRSSTKRLGGAVLLMSGLYSKGMGKRVPGLSRRVMPRYRVHMEGGQLVGDTPEADLIVRLTRLEELGCLDSLRLCP
jgi:hypothetical protein